MFQQHCGLVPLTQSEAGACDQVKNFRRKTESVMIGSISNQINCNFLKSKDADLSNLWYFISQSMNVLELWALL